METALPFILIFGYIIVRNLMKGPQPHAKRYGDEEDPGIKVSNDWWKDPGYSDVPGNIFHNMGPQD